MKHHEESKLGAFLPFGKHPTAGKFNERAAMADLSLTGDGLLPSANDQRTCTDYSEEAIPERDPAYRLPAGTLYETQTVEHIPAAGRLALARCLEQFGMSPAKAALVARL